MHTSTTRSLLRRTALMALLIALLGVAAPASAGARAHHSAAKHRGSHRWSGHRRSHAPLLGLVLTKGRARAAHRRAHIADLFPLTYHGGPVMHSNHIHAIYWFPS